MTTIRNKDGNVSDVALETPAHGRGYRPLAVAAAVLAIAVAAAALAITTTKHDGKRPRVATKAAGPSDTTDTTAAPTTTTQAQPAAAAPASAQPAPQAGPCGMPSVGSSFPDARFAASLTATPTGLLLFGGRGSDSSDRRDSWKADCGKAWARQATSVAPPANSDGPAAIAYDPPHGEAVLVANGTTWTWNGSSWADRGSAPNAQPAAAVFDSARGQVVLVGAAGGDSLSTWAWNGTAWTRKATSGPPVRDGFALAFDSARGKAYLFGGASEGGGQAADADTWSWDGAAWTKLAPATTYPRGPMLGAYDGRRGEVVALAFNGSNSQAETWAFDGNNWNKLTTAHTPPRRLYGSITYIPAIERIVLFGGKTSTVVQSEAGPAAQEQVVNDLWAWDGSDWTQLH